MRETVVQKNKMFEQDHNAGVHVPSMFVGLAVGVVGTIIYATYREREFNRLVKKTRELADRSAEYAGEAGQGLKDRAVALVDSAEDAVANLGQSVQRLVDRKAVAKN